MGRKCKNKFSIGDIVVYPMHGVGRVLEIVTQSIAGEQVSLIRLAFESDHMVVSVPLEKAAALGLRGLCSESCMNKALSIVKARPHRKRLVWGQMAEEFREKMSTGDPLAMAETLRDLHVLQGMDKEHTFNEQLLYEQAFRRFVSEFAAVKKMQLDQARLQLEKVLARVA